MLASAPRRCAGHLQPTSLPLLSHESPILPLLRQAPSRGLPSREAQGHRLCDLQVQPEVQGPPRRHPGYPPFQERPVKHVIPTVFPRTKRLPGAAFFVPALMRAWSPRGRCVSRQSGSAASRAGIPTSPPPENLTAKTPRREGDAGSWIVNCGCKAQGAWWLRRLASVRHRRVSHRCSRLRQPIPFPTLPSPPRRLKMEDRR